MYLYSYTIYPLCASCIDHSLCTYCPRRIGYNIYHTADTVSPNKTDEQKNKEDNKDMIDLFDKWCKLEYEVKEKIKETKPVKRVKETYNGKGELIEKIVEYEDK